MVLGRTVNDDCRKSVLTSATDNNWMSTHSALEASELERLKELESGQARSTGMYAELAQKSFRSGA